MNKKIALILACASFAAVTSACNESVEYSLCNFQSDGTAFCSDNNVVKCENSEPVTVQECKGDEVCTDGVCKLPDSAKECTEAETRCTEDSDAVIVEACVNGKWKVSNVDCNDKVCDSEHKKCVDKVCKFTTNNGTELMIPNGETACNENHIVTCVYPTASEDNCEIGICMDDNGKAACTARSCLVEKAGVELAHEGKVCVDGGLVTCNDGEVSEPADCDTGYVCRDGEVACAAGRDCDDVKHLAYACNADSDVEQCQDGTMVVTEECDTDNENTESRTYCSSKLKCEAAGVDDCQPDSEVGNPLIANGDYWCNGNVRRQCNIKVISEGEECSGETPYCDPTTNECRAYKKCNIGNDTFTDHTDAVCIAEPVATGYCDDGIVKQDENGACAEHQVCSYVPGAEKGIIAKCLCDTENHWIADADANKCVCDAENKYAEIGGNCEEVECTDVKHCSAALPTNGTAWTCNSDYKCELTACQNGFSLSANKLSCECTGDNVVVDGKCVTKAGCASNEVYVAATNTCACDTENNWTGEAGACECTEKHVQKDGKCEEVECTDVKHCTNTLPTNASAWTCGSDNTCKVTTCQNGFAVSTDGLSCVCDEDAGYIVVGGICAPKVVCPSHEIYVAATNTCACDAANHWTGKSGACECEERYVLKDGKCEAVECTDVKHCTSGEFLLPEKGVDWVCSSDYACHVNSCKDGFSVSSNGLDCVCPEDKVVAQNQTTGITECQEKAICTEGKELYNSLSNTCTCNTDNFWEKTDTGCACKSGYTENDGKCTRPAITECVMYANTYVLLSGSNNYLDENHHGFVKLASGVSQSNVIAQFIIGTDTNDVASWQSAPVTVKYFTPPGDSDVIQADTSLTGTMLDLLGDHVGDFYYTLGFSADNGASWQYCNVNAAYGYETDHNALTIDKIDGGTAYSVSNDVVFGYTFEGSSFTAWDGTSSYKPENGKAELSLVGTTKPTCVQSDAGKCSVAYDNNKGHVLAMSKLTGTGTSSDNAILIKADTSSISMYTELAFSFQVRGKDTHPQNVNVYYRTSDSSEWTSVSDTNLVSSDAYTTYTMFDSENWPNNKELQFLLVPTEGSGELYIDDIYLYNTGIMVV